MAKGSGGGGRSGLVPGARGYLSMTGSGGLHVRVLGATRSSVTVQNLDYNGRVLSTGTYLRLPGMRINPPARQ